MRWRKSFAINVNKQLFNCRKCGAKGHGAIDFFAWLDGIEPIPAAEQLNGRPPPNGNGKDHAAVEPKRLPRAKYKYEDESGNLAFGVVRVEYQNPAAASSPRRQAQKNIPPGTARSRTAGQMDMERRRGSRSYRTGCPS